MYLYLRTYVPILIVMFVCTYVRKNSTIQVTAELIDGSEQFEKNLK